MNALRRDSFRKCPDERLPAGRLPARISHFDFQAGWEHPLPRMVAAGFCCCHTSISSIAAVHKSQHNEEVKMRYAIVLLTALVAAACGEAPDTGVSPTSMLSVTGTALNVTLAGGPDDEGSSEEEYCEYHGEYHEKQ